MHTSSQQMLIFFPRLDSDVCAASAVLSCSMLNEGQKSSWRIALPNRSQRSFKQPLVTGDRMKIQTQRLYSQHCIHALTYLDIVSLSDSYDGIHTTPVLRFLIATACRTRKSCYLFATEWFCLPDPRLPTLIVIVVRWAGADKTRCANLFRFPEPSTPSST